MPKQQINNYPPKGLLRLGFRLPVYLYRCKLGWLLGSRFLLINHQGRKTGKAYQAVVEVVERDKQSGMVTVAAGYGPQTQWYQNLQAHPQTVIQIGSRKFDVTASILSPEEGEVIMMRYWDRYGKITGILLSALGYDWDGTEQGLRKIAYDSLRFVRFIRRS